MLKRPALLVDGKPVRVFLFAHPIKGVSKETLYEMVQVEAFDVDHAVQRLLQNFPMIPRSHWEMLDELDAEHDVGKLGRKLPMFPHGVILGSNVTH